MSNEELAVKIQGGESDCMATLWNQVDRLAWWAVRRARLPFWMTPEDLHQLGFIALEAAVTSYRPEEGAFSNWFMLHIKRTFADVCGRTKQQLFDPVNLAIPLDKPVGEDETKSPISEIIPDPTAEAMISAVEEMDEQEQRCEAVRGAVAGLPAMERSVLDFRYFQEMSVSATARALGISEKEARRLENNALRYLRHPERSRKLREVWR